MAWQAGPWQWVLAQEVVSRQMEALEVWDPTATDGFQAEIWRRHLLARIENGHLRRAKEAALEQARRLMALAPRRRVSLMVLWRVARCNHLQPVTRWADAALKAITDAANRAGMKR